MTDRRASGAARVVDWLLAHRRVVVVLASVLAVIATARTVQTYGNLRSELEQLLPENAPSVAALDKARQRLYGVRHLGIVVDAGARANDAQARRFVDDLAARLRAYPTDMVLDVRTDTARERRFIETYALQLMDPADVVELREAAEERKDDAVAQALDTDLLEEDERGGDFPLAEMKKKYEKRHAPKRAFPDGRFISQDRLTHVIVVRTSSQGTGYSQDAKLLERIRADAEELGFPDSYAPDMRFGFAGDVPTRVEEMDALVTDLSLSGALVLLLVVGVIVAFFRRFEAVFLLGIPLLLGTVYTFALVALPPFSIRSLNSNTAFLGSIVVGNGINTGIILLARFREEHAPGVSVDEALRRAAAGTWRPTLAAALAAAAAYGSLIVTDFRGFNQFGWIGGIGMLVCWLTTWIVAPPLISWFGGKLRPAPNPQAGRESRWTRLAPRRGLVLAVTAVLSVASVAAIAARTDTWLETDFSKLRRRDSWQVGERYWGGRMDATLGTYLTPTVILTDSPEAAQKAEEGVAHLKKRGAAGDLIGSVRSVRTLLPEHREANLKEALSIDRELTPKVRSELSESERKQVATSLSPASLRLLTAQQLPDSMTAGLKERDGSVDKTVLVYPKLSKGTWNADRMAAFSRDLRAASADASPAATVTGSLLLSSDIVAAMKADGPKATLIAFGIVCLVALLAFRSWRLSVFAVTSLVVGVTLMLGAMAVGGQKLNFSNFVALPITFGIAADYSINVLKRFQASEGAAAGTLGGTGGAVTLCSLTTIIGFGSLLVAQNLALFSFGVFAVAGELTCLFTAVVVLPAWVKRRARATSTPEPVAAST